MKKIIIDFVSSVIIHAKNVRIHPLLNVQNVKMINCIYLKILINVFMIAQTLILEIKENVKNVMLKYLIVRNVFTMLKQFAYSVSKNIY